MADTPDWTSPATRINPTANLTAAIAAPGNVVQVDDTSGFRVGDTVAVTGQLSGNQETFTNLYITAIGSGQVTVDGDLPVGLTMPGDVVGFPTVVVQPPANTAGVQVQLVAHDDGSDVWNANADESWSMCQLAINNAAPSLTVTPPSGKHVTVTRVHAVYSVSSGGGAGIDVVVSGATKGVLWAGKVAVPATNECGMDDSSGMAIAFGTNEVVTIKFNASTGSTGFGSLSAGGYYR